MTRLGAVGAAARGAVTRRRVAAAVLTACLAALALLVASVDPGPTMRWSPIPGVGVRTASVGPLTVEVHGATLASSIAYRDDVFTTTGTFVVLDVTTSTTEEIDLVARDLVVDGVVFDLSTKGPPSWMESHPAPGMPVSGQIVFEVDSALVDGGATAWLLVAPGFDASGDLEPQVRVRVDVAGSVVERAEVEVVSR